MNTVSDLFEAFGGTTALARALGVGTSTASEMKRRGSIPVDHWPALVSAAGDRLIAGVSPDALMRMHVRRERPLAHEDRIAL